MEKISIEDMQEIARKRGGKCLSSKYINIDTKLEWQCSNNHIWKASSDKIKNAGRWCPKCAGNFPLSLKEMHKIAKDNGGKCLSKKYLNARSKLEWMCSKGHTWKTTPGHIKNKKTWCPKCAGVQILTIEEMHSIAKKRRGKCLSKKYTNAQTKLKWKCSEGHQWYAIPNSVKRGNWCPKCHYFHAEELCRTTFEQIFKKKFLKIRPKWLISSSGYPMELDGYSRYYNLAFEYQGEQHFKLHRWNRNKNNLAKRLKDDKIKVNLCRKNKVSLLVISYKDDLTNLPNIIKQKLKLIGFKTKNINFDQEIDFNKIYHHEYKIKLMQNLAKTKQGKCLSKKYINIHSKLKWKCSNGHIWHAKPSNIKSGKWCPKCAGNYPLTIADMHTIATTKKGRCLSKVYVNNRTNLKWKCSIGHIWHATPYKIKNKTWCPKCAGNYPSTIKDMHTIAKTKNGQCLSKKYISTHSKLKWKCSNGHIWYAQPANIKIGRWCPKCAIESRRTKKIYPLY